VPHVLASIITRPLVGLTGAGKDDAVSLIPRSSRRPAGA